MIHHKNYVHAEMHFKHAIEEIQHCSRSLDNYSLLTHAKKEYEEAIQTLIDKFGVTDPRLPTYQQCLQKSEDNLIEKNAREN